MKIHTLTVLAGVAAPLIATASASAGFVGISTVSKPNPFAALTVNVYAEFDRPDPGDGSGDHMLGVFGTPDTPLLIEVIGGTFYNSSFGNDIAPLGVFVNVFRELAFETFVTIGVKQVGKSFVYPGQPVNNTVLTAGFPVGITGSVLATTTSGWLVLPTDAQGDPFDPVNSFPAMVRYSSASSRPLTARRSKARCCSSSSATALPMRPS